MPLEPFLELEQGDIVAGMQPDRLLGGVDRNVEVAGKLPAQPVESLADPWLEPVADAREARAEGSESGALAASEYRELVPRDGFPSTKESPRVAVGDADILDRVDERTVLADRTQQSE